MSFGINKKQKHSVYTALLVAVVCTVFIIMSLHMLFTYNQKKEEMIATMQHNSSLSITSLQKNLIAPMEAYAVHEYEKIVLTEVELRDHFAIVIEDYNMGKIVGQEAFISGYIHDDENHIVNLVGEGQKFTEKLEECFYKESGLIYAQDGTAIGKIRVYINGQKMEDALHAIIVKALIDTLLISLLLVISLIAVIRYFLLQPFLELVASLGNRGQDGLPLQKIPDFKYKEISLLGTTLNSMLQIIKNSRLELEEKHFELQKASLINKMILKTIPDLIWLKDKEGRYIMCNPKFEQFYRAKEEEIVGKDDYAFVSKELADFFRKHDKIAMEAGKSCSNEEWLMFDTGEKILARTIKTPLILSDGSVIGILGIAHDITRYKALIKELEYSAKHDNLTSIPNRYLFEELMQYAMRRCKRKKYQMALFFIDLDNFKIINDSYGHEAGDEVLKEVALRLQKVFRMDDIIARLGGDEFVVAITDFVKQEDVVFMIEKMIAEVRKPIAYKGNQLCITLSVGVSYYPQNLEVDLKELLNQADNAMYLAKNGGTKYV